MSTRLPHVLADSNLSFAWARAFLEVMETSTPKLTPLVVTVDGFHSSQPSESQAIRQAVDRSLSAHRKHSTRDSAFTIFPYQLWNRECHRSKLFETYLGSVLPRLKARGKANRHGTYFERMIAFEGTKKERGVSKVFPKNQLDHIISTWNRDVSNDRHTRRSALQVACFDPAKDLTGAVLCGFPCLQQLSFSYDGDLGLALNAYYPTQYIYDRGYGNYLGLCHLGQFMAKELELNLVRMTCFIGQPELGKQVGKNELSDLADEVRNAMALT